VFSRMIVYTLLGLLPSASSIARRGCAGRSRCPHARSARYFIRKVYETDPLTCPKCPGEMRIISFIDQPDVIKKILEHLGLWEESQAAPDRNQGKK
jgi:hypothetical protein